jgi:hypothetical protein
MSMTWVAQSWTGESDRRGTKDIVVKLNNAITNDPCAICGGRCDPDGVDLFLEGTSRLVCDVCGWEHVPELQRMRYLWSHAAAMLAPDFVPDQLRGELRARRAAAFRMEMAQAEADAAAVDREADDYEWALRARRAPVMAGAPEWSPDGRYIWNDIDSPPF